MPDGQRHALRHGAARNRPCRRGTADHQGLSADDFFGNAEIAGTRWAGRTGKGTITGLFTVLVDGDDHNEPIADAARSILDGHIVLDRAIAERGRFPAVNVLRSISRTMPACNNDEKTRSSAAARRYLAAYENMAEMIRLGAYRKGATRKSTKR